MKKKALSLIFSIVLFAGLVPATVQAQEGIPKPEAIEAEVTESEAAEVAETEISENEEETLIEDTSEVKANQVKIDAINFPDDNFRAYIKEKFDENNDDYIDDIENVTYIGVDEKGISSLKGIEKFTALEILSCNNNQLTSLDVSHNPALKSLDCFVNHLTNLDVSHNSALEYLGCGQNNLTDGLNISNNQALDYLDCMYSNLTSLDVSHNPVLETLDCSGNKLTNLDVSHNPALDSLQCGKNELTSLDVSHNPVLRLFDCSYNKLTNLDVSNNPKLFSFGCAGNSLTSLDLSHNPALDRITCSNNQLTSLNVSHCSVLTLLWCDHNELSDLDVSNIPTLHSFYCYRNQLTSLDLSHNPKVRLLGIDSYVKTDISALDLFGDLEICVPQSKGTIDLSDIIGIEKYMSGFDWDADTKKFTYDLEKGLTNYIDNDLCTFVYYYKNNDNNNNSNNNSNSNNSNSNSSSIEPFAIYAGNSFCKDANGNVRCYDSNGNPVINEFKCDGIYTYYFQLDGTAMKNRLTYHPDGLHIIYFDEEGHEVFSNFHHVERSIAGEVVDDLCFFDVYGYMYVDVMTYDEAGVNLYYVNPYGVIEQKGWFEFSDTCVWAGTTNKVGKGFGYANADGTLLINTYTYDWTGRYVYLMGDGHIE